jgi:hypothetical protein
MTVNIANLPSYTLVHVPQANVDVVIIAATSLQLLNDTYGIVSLNLETLRLFLPKQNQRGLDSVNLVSMEFQLNLHTALELSLEKTANTNSSVKY